jgi:hypothetical protein
MDILEKLNNRLNESKESEEETVRDLKDNYNNLKGLMARSAFTGQYGWNDNSKKLTEIKNKLTTLGIKFNEKGYIINESKEELEENTNPDTSLIMSLRKLSQCDLNEEYLFPMVTECFNVLSGSKDKLAKDFMSKASPKIKEIAESIINDYMDNEGIDIMPVHAK